MASVLQLDIIPDCQLCRAIIDGKLDMVHNILETADSLSDKDDMAVYLLVKYYLQHLTDFAQTSGDGLSLVWKSADIQGGRTRKSVIELLKTLFKFGLTANTQHGEETPLLCAVSTHDGDLVKVMLENGADSNIMTPTNKMNAVALAIILNDAAILKLLLSYGAKVNEPCCQRLTPLQLSMNKSVQVSKVLLQNGADVQQVMQMHGCNEVFVTSPPLIHAVETNNLFLASILLEHGEDINQCNGDCTNSPIHFAIQNGNNDMVKLLIQYGANLNKRNGRGHTPLGMALHHCKNENIQIIAETLLAAGCSRTKGSLIEVFQRHFPPLHIAAFLGTQYHLVILKQLIAMSNQVGKTIPNLNNCSADANGGKQSEEGVLKADPKYRQSLSNSERTTDLIVKGQQEFINTQAMDKSTALYMAVLGDNINVAKYLCEKGADPYLTCWHGSLLHAAVMACKRGEELVKFALQFQLDLNMLNEDGNTCLILAARNSTSSVCRLLIEHGALLNVRDGRFGETALSASVYFGFEDNAAMLLSCGADPDVPDSRFNHFVFCNIY